MNVKDFNQQLIAIGGTMNDAFHPTDSDEQNDSPRYYGAVTLDGRYLIVKETNTAGLKTYRIAYGGSGYATAWTGRAGLDYDYWYNLRSSL